MKLLSKIGLVWWVRPNALLISLSVPKYSPYSVCIVALLNDIVSRESSSILNAFMNTLTCVSILGRGVNTNSTTASLPDPAPVILVPIVPNPATDSKIPYSVS